VIALGDRAHAVDAWLQPLYADFAFCSLEAPRAADPRRYGVPTRSGDWYLAHEAHVADEQGPEPSSFGLALIALERFVLQERSDSLRRPPILLGVGQGATLSLALARCWAEELAGVVAIDGPLAELPAGAIEEAPLAGLPILILDTAGPAGDASGPSDTSDTADVPDTNDAEQAPDASEHARAHLADLGACVTLARSADRSDGQRRLGSWLTQVVASGSSGVPAPAPASGEARSREAAKA
jgi:hypothetical protein